MILTITGLIGITVIITSSPILKKLREKIRSKSLTLYNFSICSLCIGFILGSVVKWSLIFGGVIGILSYIVDLMLTCTELNIFLKSGLTPPRDKKLSETEKE